MTKLFIDFNDNTGPGRFWVRPKMQPGGTLPASLASGQRVLLIDRGEDEEYEAVLEFDSGRHRWIADTDAPATIGQSSSAASATGSY